MKTCKGCGEEKPLDGFHSHPTTRDRKQTHCKTCTAARNIQRDPRQKRDYTLRHKFGITSDQYDAMMSAQAGVCAICREPCSAGRRLAVDHNHVSKKVRGLLCLNCNTSLGGFKDDPKLLAGAIHYLNVNN